MEVKTLKSPIRKEILIVSSTIFGVLLIIILSLLIVINQRFEESKNPNSKFYSLVTGLNPKSSFYALLYHFNFLSVRLLVGGLIYLTDEIPSLYLWIIFSSF